MEPKGEEDGTVNSETSSQSFQEEEFSGLEAQPDRSECLPSTTVSAQLPIVGEQLRDGGHWQAGQTGAQVAPTATQNENTSTHIPSRCSVEIGGDLRGVDDKDGARTEKAAGCSGEVDSMREDRLTLAQGVAMDAATCCHSAVDAQSNPGDARKDVSEAKNWRLQAEVGHEVGPSPGTNLQPHTIEGGVVRKQNVGCKNRLGDQRKEDSSTCLAQAEPIEQQKACAAADGHGQDRSGGASSASDCGTENIEVEEGEEDALLLPDAPASHDPQIEDVNGWMGHDSGSSLPATLENVALEAKAGIETEAEDLLVDDIDDESSTLLDRSPVASTSCPKPPPAPTSTTTGAATAAVVATSAVAPLSSSPASSSAGGAPGADAPSLPLATTPAAAAPVMEPTSTATADASAFNYYELPAVPPEATEQPEGRSTRASDPSTGNVRQPSLSRAPSAEEHVSISSSSLVLPFRLSTYARRLLGCTIALSHITLDYVPPPSQ